MGTGSEILERKLNLTALSLSVYSLRQMPHASEVRMLNWMVTMYVLAGCIYGLYTRP
jgi:hypothetical protein